MNKQVITIIQTRRDCNLNCKYCYLGEKDFGIQFDLDLVDKIFKEITDFNGANVVNEIIWHGGEPLLAGIDFFRQVLKLQKTKYENFSFLNCLQTNGTLLTREWVYFFKENEFHIGISLDGPKELHDSNRVYYDNGGSFDLIMQGVEICKELELRLGFLCVLTKKSIGKEKIIYDFFKSTGYDFDFSPVATKNQDISLNNQEYAKMANTFFDLWFFDNDQKIKVRPPSTLVNAFLIDENVFDCTFHNKCLEDYISVAPDGNVYPCNRFANINEFLIGNIQEQCLEEILKTSKIRDNLLTRAVDCFEGCKSCEIKKYCNAGCPHQAYELNDDYFTPDFYCEAYKSIIPHVFNEVNSQLINAKN